MEATVLCGAYDPGLSFTYPNLSIIIIRFDIIKASYFYVVQLKNMVNRFINIGSKYGMEINTP